MKPVQRLDVRTSRNSTRSRPARSIKAGPILTVEALENREVLSTYALLSNQWVNKSRLTWSIASDGVYWFKSINQLPSNFDAQLGTNWRTEIAEAAYAWSAVSDLDLTQVLDGQFDGDYYLSPSAKSPFGDIRIGGYDFANSQILASTFGPPPDGWSRAGDISVNLGVDWKPGPGYDLKTVILHELGHSLGLDHVEDAGQCMFARYQGVKSQLSPGDIAGIQSLFGVRADDSYTLAGVGLTSGKPIVMAAPTGSARTSTVAGVELAAAGAVDYFRIDVPEHFAGTRLAVTASASGVSMLSPALSFVGPDGYAIRTASSAGVWGAEVTIDLGPVIGGQSFVFRVNSAEADRFAIGGYRVAANFTGGQVSPPPVPTPPPPAPAPPLVVVPPAPVQPAPVQPITTINPVVTPVITSKPVVRQLPVRKKTAPTKFPAFKSPQIPRKITTPSSNSGQNSLLSALRSRLL